MADVRHVRRYDGLSIVTLIGNEENGIIMETPYLDLLMPDFTPDDLQERIMRRALIVDAARYDGYGE